MPDLFRPTRPASARVTALFLAVLLALAAVPSGAFAASSEYSAGASATVVTVDATPVAPAVPVTVVAGETTAALNSSANIVADTPATTQNESKDIVVVTITPVRVEPGDRENPGSVQISAPGEAFSIDFFGSQGTVTVDDSDGTQQATLDPPVSFGVASTTVQQSQLGNDNRILTGELVGLPVLGYGLTALEDVELNAPTADVTIGSATSLAVVDHAGEFTINPKPGDFTMATAEVAIGGPSIFGGPGKVSSFFGGFVTIQELFTSVVAAADGTESTATRDFRLVDLVFNDAPAGSALITVHRGDNLGPNGRFLVLDITVHSGSGTRETITVRAGSDLLDPTTYAGTTLAAPFLALGAALAPVAGPGGPLQDLAMVLGDGFIDKGDGTYARASYDGLKMSANPNGTSSVTTTVASVYAGADAVRADSSATSAALAPGAMPTEDPDTAFAATVTAAPTETVISAPIDRRNNNGRPFDPCDAGDRRNVGFGPEDQELFADLCGLPAAQSLAAADLDRLPNTGADTVPAIWNALLLLGFGVALYGGVAIRGRRRM